MVDVYVDSKKVGVGLLDARVTYTSIRIVAEALVLQFLVTRQISE